MTATRREQSIAFASEADQVIAPNTSGLKLTQRWTRFAPDEADPPKVLGNRIVQSDDDRNQSVQVTAVIPTIGRPSLVRAVESVLQQTLAVTKVLVVADGLEYGPVVRGLLDHIRSDNVEVHAIPRVCAPARVRNAGLQLVMTDFVAWLDDDDHWTPDKLEIQATLFEPGIVAVSSNALILSDTSTTPLLSITPARTPFKKLIGENPVITSTVVCRTASLKAVGGFPETPYLLDDYAAWCRLACEGDFWISDHCLAVYTRNGPQSVSSRLAENGKRKFHSNVSLVVMATMRYTLSEKRPILVLYCALFLIRYSSVRLMVRPRKAARSILQKIATWLPNV